MKTKYLQDWLVHKIQCQTRNQNRSNRHPKLHENKFLQGWLVHKMSMSNLFQKSMHANQKDVHQRRETNEKWNTMPLTSSEITDRPITTRSKTQKQKFKDMKCVHWFHFKNVSRLRRGLGQYRKSWTCTKIKFPAKPDQKSCPHLLSKTSRAPPLTLPPGTNRPNNKSVTYLGLPTA